MKSNKRLEHWMLNRRQFSGATLSTLIAQGVNREYARHDHFQFKFMLASCMYGYMDLNEVMPEVTKTGAQAIDIWPKVHGNQREQLDEMGQQRFAQLLRKHKITLGCITQYKLGPFGLQSEMPIAKSLGCSTLVCGGAGPKGLTGTALKSAVAQFVEKMKPHLAVATEHGISIAIENHANNLICSPDSLKWLVELGGENLGVALAPYHLEQDAESLARLIRELDKRILVFYAWQHGTGCMTKQPKQDELQQMPGRGKLDFGPIVKALSDIQFEGWTEIFMHPFPRGIPILPEKDAVTHEINRARNYLNRLAES